ncbi:MAG: hypothetical protein WC993_04885, partial [Methanoculleus sp.]
CEDEEELDISRDEEKSYSVPLGEYSEQTNRWRETSFAVYLIRCALNPILSLGRSLKHWHSIAKKLAEKKRKRSRQLPKLYQHQHGLDRQGG